MTPEERESAKQRKRDERQRYKDAGLVPVTVHVQPEAKSKLLDYVKRLVWRTGKK